MSEQVRIRIRTPARSVQPSRVRFGARQTSSGSIHRGRPAARMLQSREIAPNNRRCYAKFGMQGREEFDGCDLFIYSNFNRGTIQYNTRHNTIGDRTISTICRSNLNTIQQKSQFPVQVGEKRQYSFLKTCFLLIDQRELTNIYGKESWHRSGDARTDIWGHFVFNLQASQLI